MGEDSPPMSNNNDVSPRRLKKLWVSGGSVRTLSLDLGRGLRPAWRFPVVDTEQTTSAIGVFGHSVRGNGDQNMPTVVLMLSKGSNWASQGGSVVLETSNMTKREAITRKETDFDRNCTVLASWISYLRASDEQFGISSHMSICRLDGKKRNTSQGE